jgi:nucleoside-diphosphate-sugar epimerase
MATFVVTGGAGFIGSNVVHRLVADGERVRVIDDLSSGRLENLAGVEDAVDFTAGSILDAALLRDAFSGADYVLHQAARANVVRSVEDPIASNAVNVEGTLNVLNAARACGVKRVVYASSSSVYGNAPELPKREDVAPDPRSPYAVSKLAAEHYCRVFTEVYGLQTVSLRYFNVFGPRQDPASAYAAVVPAFIRRLLDGQEFTVFGDGEQSRDFTYVDNAVEANLLAARAEGAAGRVFNVGCGRRYTLNRLVEVLQDLLHTSVRPRYLPDRPGDVRHSLADISAARSTLGYEPTVAFEEGLRRTVDWYRRAS